MRSLDSMRRPKRPTQDEVINRLSGIEEKTLEEEYEAKRIGVSEEEYERRNKEKILRAGQAVHSNEENTKFFKMKSLIEQWQRDYNEGTQSIQNLIPPNVVVNNTLFKISDEFVSFVLEKARESDIYERHGAVLNDFSNIIKIEIKKEENWDDLCFEVSAIKETTLGGRYRDSTSFYLDANGTVKLI